MLRRDEGSVLLLAVGAVLLALAVVVALTDTSSLYMRRSALAQVADEAALAGATEADVDRLYAEGVGEVLPLAAGAACATAAAHLHRAESTMLRDIALEACAVDGARLQLVVSAARPDLLSPLPAVGGGRIRVVARAVAPTRW